MSFSIRMPTASFRWGGEFTPQARGPRVVGLAQPLPLPSTVLGTLAAIQHRQESLSHCDWLSMLGECTVRGPYVRVVSRNAERLLLHHYTVGLVEVVKSETGLKVRRVDIRDVGVVDRSATSLRYDTRTVVEHLLYSQRLINYAPTSELMVELYSHPELTASLADVCSPVVNGLRSDRVVRFVVRFGGEGYPAIISYTDRRPLCKLVKSAWADRNNKSQEDNKRLEDSKRLLAYVATPLILADNDAIGCSSGCGGSQSALSSELRCYARRMLRGEPIELPTGDRTVRVRVRAPTRREMVSNIGRVAEGLDAKALRVKLDVIGLGWDMKSNARRPAVPVIQPGSLIVVELDCINPINLYLEGVGALSKAGWGTVIPLASLP